ncbi:MAG TPA: hypothetical protein VL475_02825 [Planctomycetaceae bacterium]|nr:hypothetical protein [Planctomycetaceae bacterium]
MRIHPFMAVLTITAAAAVGCGPGTASGPFGAPQSSALMAPFAGAWTFDFDRTLDAQKAAGAVTDEQIRQLRQMYAANPALGKMHPDLTFDGNVAAGAGFPSSEYRFFGLHKHGEQVCEKAWHHEDRFDPGDMSKCYVRLSLVEGRLHLEVNMQDGLPDLNDPDLTSEPAVERDASQCDLEAKAGRKPEDWATYVFARRP